MRVHPFVCVCVCLCLCGEAFIELQKAFHGVNRPEMCTGLNFQSYNCTDLAIADTTVGGIAATGLPLIAATSLGANSYKYGFAIAQEMESFAQKDGLLLSGMNGDNFLGYKFLSH